MLAACNNNDNAAFDALDRDNNNNNNNVSNVSYHRGDNVGDAFRMRNGNDTAEELNTANNGFTGTRDFAYNTRKNPRHNSSNELAGSMDNSISADFTNMSSGQYPHTKPVQIQDAKFGYVVTGPQGGTGQGMNMADLQSMTEQYARQFQAQIAPRGQWAQWGQGQRQNAQQFAQAGQANQRPQMQQQPTQRPAQQQAPAQQQQVQQPVQKAPTAQPSQQQKPTAQPTQPAKTTPTTQGISAAEQKVIDLTNAERQKAGIKPLIGDSKLSSVARTKSNDMQAKGYFSHTSPTYGSPFDMMRDFGITYSTAGENIAQGQRTPEEVVQAWMNSEGHRRNILNPAFTHIGVGYESTGNHWTQQFIGK